MAKIIYSPSVVDNPDVQTPRQLPDDYQRIPTDTGQFGSLIGSAEIQGGARLEQASNELADTAFKIQNVKNTTDANSATQQYVDAVNKVFYGDGTDANKGLFNLKGREALDALPAAMKQMKQVFTDGGNTLNNPVAKNMYDAETRRYYMAHEDQVFRFGQAAQKEYAENQNNSQIASAHTSSALNYNNDTVADADIDRATNGLVQNYQLKYGNPTDETRANLRQEAITKNMEARVNGAVARGDFTTAHSILDKYGPGSDPEKYRGMNDILNREEHEAKTRGLTDSGKDLGDQILNHWMNGGPAPVYKGPTSPGGSAAPSAIHAAIYGTEGSGPQAVSVQGATGRAQILESTFNSNKQPGESFNNEQDRETVANRLIDNYTKQYNGDASRVAVAYFSGPGNVAPPGNPTPWISDKRDGNGNSTSNYVKSVLGRLGGSGSSTPKEQEQPAESGTSAAPEAAPVQFRGVGDSLAAGAISSGKAQGSWGKSPNETEKDAAWSRSPQQVMDFISSRPEGYFKGQDILLSTGVSNAPGQINLVPDQIAALKKDGAKSVTVLGLGKRADLSPLNKNLQDVANEAQVPFAGPLQGTEKDREQVHPVGSYPQMVAQAQKAYQDYRQSNPATPSPPADAGGEAATGAPDTVAGEKVPAAGPQAPNQVPFPSKEQMINMIPPNAPIEVRHAAMARINQAFEEMNARSFEERRKMVKWLPGLEAKLSDGQLDNSTAYDPATIRHYLPPVEADEWVDRLDQAKQIGTYAAQMRTMNPVQIQDISDKLHHDLKYQTPDLYRKNEKIVTAFDAAAKAQIQQLAGKDADPAGFLRRIDPVLDQKAKALDPKNPQSVDDYVTAMGARQTQMGVPKAMQHIVTTQQSLDMAHSIMADPSKSADVLQGMKQQWGDHWNDVFADAVSLGKLPAPYQMVQHLQEVGNPHDAALLARGMGGAQKESGTKAKEFWEDTIGPKEMGNIKTSLLGSPRLQNFVHSLMDSNAPQDQIDSLIQSVHTLAYAKEAYDKSGNPADEAVQAVAGKYAFLSEYGGPRVPADREDTVRQNINFTKNRLDLPSLQVPKLSNGVTPEQWLAMLKAKPHWVTTPREDGIQLLDSGGKPVINKAGDPIEIPFSMSGLGPPSIMPAPDYNGP